MSPHVPRNDLEPLSSQFDAQKNPDADTNSKLAVSSLTSFPAEVLGEIFLRCIPVPGNKENLRAYFPWSLTHVCRHWRTSALAFPKLWSFIDVEQTQENQEGDCPEFFLMEAYLERSGNHPLTFRLAYENETMHYETFLEQLEQHAARWFDVYVESPNHYALWHLAHGDPSECSLLRSFVCTYANLDCGAVPEGLIFHSIPWAQLQRYHEYRVEWSDCARQWEIISQLKNVVDLRVSFCGEYEVQDRDEGDTPVFEMPHLRFASLAIDGDAEGLYMEGILDCFDFPAIQGLNLKLTDAGTLSPVPDQFKRLKILRLCGSLAAISNEDLLGILTEIDSLADFAVDLRGVDVEYLFGLLSVSPTSSLLVPRLRVLRTTDFKFVKGALLDALLGMLRQRFAGVDEAEFTRLERFEFFLGACPSVFNISSGEWEDAAHDVSSTTFDDLEALRTREGWDIRVHKEWLGDDFWREEMDTEFL
ncbi:hypothetical protein K438DRAFT_1964003 [Mycena galopus ATCC 62051]|nr:hypothetical protein K438DRAFT_1964003 [Mycena galopus ATCC 62051]